MELQDERAMQHTALLEFKTGDWYGPTKEQLDTANRITRDGIGHMINDVMCEIEKREPGTFTTY